MDILSAQQTAKPPGAQGLPNVGSPTAGGPVAGGPGAAPAIDMFQSLLGNLIDADARPTGPAMQGINARLLQSGALARPLRMAAVDGTGIAPAPTSADAPLRLRMATGTALTPPGGDAVPVDLGSRGDASLDMQMPAGDALPSGGTSEEESRVADPTAMAAPVPEGTVPTVAAPATAAVGIGPGTLNPVDGGGAVADTASTEATPTIPGFLAGPAGGSPAQTGTPATGTVGGAQGATAGAAPAAAMPTTVPNSAAQAPTGGRGSDAPVARTKAGAATSAASGGPAARSADAPADAAPDGPMPPGGPAEPGTGRQDVAEATPATDDAQSAAPAMVAGTVVAGAGVAGAGVAGAGVTNTGVAGAGAVGAGAALAAPQRAVNAAQADGPKAKVDALAAASPAAEATAAPTGTDGSPQIAAEHRDWRGQAREARSTPRGESDRPQAQPTQPPTPPVAPPAPAPGGPAPLEAPGAMTAGPAGIAAAAASQDRSGRNDASGGGSGHTPGDPSGGPVDNADGAIPSQASATGESNRAPAADFAQQLAAARHARNGVHHPAPQQIAVHVQRAAQDGQDRLTLHLRPVDLGRIDVQLDFGKDGLLRAQVLVENPATLDMLQRDARGLERALQDAGLKTDANGLNFSLRDQGGEAQRENDRPKGRNANLRLAEDPTLDAAALPRGAGPVLGPGRVDVRI